MDLIQWLSLAGVCLLGAMSPGPSLAVILNSTLRGNRPAGYASAAAHSVATALYALLTVGGLAVLVKSSPALFTAIQWLGALFLVYLGIRSLRYAGVNKFDAGEKALTGPTLRGAALQGFMVAFLNPKLAVFLLALFSQFLRPEASWAERGTMVAVAGTIDGLWYAIVVTGVSQPAILDSLKLRSSLIDRIFGVLLLVLALRILLQ